VHQTNKSVSRKTHHRTISECLRIRAAATLPTLRAVRPAEAHSHVQHSLEDVHPSVGPSVVVLVAEDILKPEVTVVIVVGGNILGAMMKYSVRHLQLFVTLVIGVDISVQCVLLLVVVLLNRTGCCVKHRCLMTL